MTSKIIDKTKEVLGMDKKDIALTGKKVGSTGYGMMGLTAFYGDPTPQDQAFAAMKAALDTGANFWNGGEFYGSREANSLHLLNAYFTKYPEDADKVVLSIKGGAVPGQMAPDGRPDNVRRSIDECLKQLDGKKYLDLFECARVDPNVPIEQTLGAAKEYVDAGKIGGICLSEASEKSIRRAAKIVKVEAVEEEFSLWSTEILDNGVAKACAELDIPIIAYSPLGRGFLTGQIKKLDDLADNDFRRYSPRFQGENFDKNIKLVQEIEKIAAQKGVTAGQIGLAWVKKMGQRAGMPKILPIPGSTNPARVKENVVDVDLSEGDMEEIDAILKSFTVTGGRYPEGVSALSFGDSPEQ